MRVFRRGSEGQAAVESALTIPMMVFTMLGIVQLSLAYHARILAEYAAFKTARSGSVYRADCGRMKKAALAALAPSMSHTHQTNPNMLMLFLETQGANDGNTATWKDTKGVTGGGGTTTSGPIVWVDYKLENVDQDFDKLLEPGSTEVPRIRVKLAYFFQYRIPFANWVMVRFWLARQGLLSNWGQQDKSDSTMMNVKARAPDVDKLSSHRKDSAAIDELVNKVYVLALSKFYTSPIVTSWSMRMFSDPLPAAKSASGDWKCK
jgi:hypothetical protein